MAARAHGEQRKNDKGNPAKLRHHTREAKHARSSTAHAQLTQPAPCFQRASTSDTGNHSHRRARTERGEGFQIAPTVKPHRAPSSTDTSAALEGPPFVR